MKYDNTTYAKKLCAQTKTLKSQATALLLAYLSCFIAFFN